MVKIRAIVNGFEIGIVLPEAPPAGLPLLIATQHLCECGDHFTERRAVVSEAGHGADGTPVYWDGHSVGPVC